MAFSQDGVSGVTVRADGPDLFIRWDSAAPDRTTFQVYVDHRLSWYGASRSCHVPIPAGASGRNVWVDVGVVAAGEAYLDHSAALPGTTRRGDHVQISWTGGTYLDPSGSDDVLGFRIYRSSRTGAPVDRSTPVGVVPAYPGGRIGDGFGVGGSGLGGFGRSATNYVWTSASLPSGTWQFAVVPFDKAGTDRGTGATVGLNVTTAPRPPAPALDGRRLTYSYSGAATRRITLQWLASPSS